MIQTLVTLLIEVLVIGLLCYLIFWAMNYLGFPEPARKIITVIVVVLVCIALLHQFLPVAGLTPTLRR